VLPHTPAAIALVGEITEYQPRIEPRQRVVGVGDQPLQRGDNKLVYAGLLFGVHGSLFPPLVALPKCVGGIPPGGVTRVSGHHDGQPGASQAADSVASSLAELGEHRLGVEATAAGVAALCLTSPENRVVQHRHRGVAGA
jgi:hypothetical protein